MMSGEMLQYHFIGGTVASALTLVIAAGCVPLFGFLLGRELRDAWIVPLRIALLGSATVIGAIAVFLQIMKFARHATESVGRRISSQDEIVIVFWMTVDYLALALTIFFSILLATKLYQKWVNDRMSDAERSPGAPGYRAWCGLANILLVIAISICGSVASDFSIWGILLVAMVLILIYPTIATFGVTSGMPAVATEASPERERVMRMLEQGRITGEEAAELLGALSTPVAPIATIEPMTSARKLMLAGAAMVLIGFFLPWFEVNLAAKLESISQIVPPGQPITRVTTLLPPQSQTVMSIQSSGVRTAGGDVIHGMGWMILIAGVGAAAVPYMLTGLTRDARRKLTMVLLATGSVIGLYLLVGDFQNVSIGLPVVLAGFAVQIFAVLSEFRRPLDLVPPMPAVA